MTTRPTATGRRYVWTPATRTVDVYTPGSSRTLRSKITGAHMMADLHDACLAIMDNIYGHAVAREESGHLQRMLMTYHYRGPLAQIQITETAISAMRAGRYWNETTEVGAEA